MPTVPATNSTAVLGITNLLEGFTILNETIDETETVLPIPDQLGAIVNELPVDKRHDLSITFYGSGTLPAAGATTFEYGGKTYKVEKISKAGVYNDYQKYTLTAHRYTNFPAGA